VDKDYNWDNIDKSGVLYIPPVMIGNIDTIYLEGLPEGIFPGGIPLPDWSITKSDTIKGLFDGDAVKDFFFDGAGDVEITARADIDLEIEGIFIDIYFNVINYNNARITQVVIPKQNLTIGKDQNLSIKIASEYMQYMEEAKDLELTINLRSEDASIWIGEDDYIFIKNAIVKTGGFHFEL